MLALTFSMERLDILTYRMGKRKADLKKGLGDCLQEMYEKYMPQTTRKYLDGKIIREGTTRLARPRRQAEKSHVRSRMGREIGQVGST